MVKTIISDIIPVLKEKKVYLASASPRRRQLVADLDIDVELIEPRDVDETYPDNMSPESVAEYISHKKAEAYLHDLKPDRIIVTADTVVVCGNEVLGKPHGGVNAAKEMLKKLSGRKHKVVTGVTLTTTEKSVSFSTVTEVIFDELTEDEIDYYVETYKPMDKAGAYGIQEWIGCIGISGINGCFYNVMGLPLHDLFKELKKFKGDE